MNKNLNKLKFISKEINKFIISNNNICVDRNRKNNITDAILYKLYYTKNTSSQEKAVIKLNKFKPKSKLTTTRQSLIKKENKINVNIYEKIANKLNALINNNINNKYTKQIIAVDGTYTTCLKSLNNDNFKLNKNKESVTPLITGLFNITTNMPIILELAEEKNEKKAFLKYIKNKNEFKSNIFVFDRGYDSDNLFNYLNLNEMHFICRIKNNRKIVNDQNYNFININGYKIRIVKYKINDNEYNIATNLFNFSLDEIKNIYNQRWTCEEYFKYVKSNLNLDKLNEHREKNIRKSIIANLIISQIAFLFNNLYKNESKIVNKSILTDGIYEDFLYKFLNNSRFTNNFILKFIKLYVKLIKSKKNRTYIHQCKRSNYKWYIKNKF
jgi:hypothetical protein